MRDPVAPLIVRIISLCLSRCFVFYSAAADAERARESNDNGRVVTHAGEAIKRETRDGLLFSFCVLGFFLCWRYLFRSPTSP